MISFKRNFSVMTLLALSLVLSACLPKTKDRPEGSENDAANYVVASVSGTVTGSRNVGDFPLPGEKTYNFKACLIDYSRRTNIPNAKFLIQELDQELKTDAQGCLNWPETIKFNYLGDSVWVKQTRTLVARGLQRGSREVKFAINPWSHGEALSEVLDLAKQSTPYLVEDADEVKARLEGKGKDGKLVARRLWVEGGERNVVNGKMQGSAFTWHDQIFLKPQIQFGKMDGTPVQVAVQHGSFQVEISLISEDVQGQQTKRTLWAKKSMDQVSMMNNTLMIDVDFSLNSAPSSGQTMMGIKLTPIGAPAGLQAFEGIFPLGNQSFTQSTGLKISETVAAENRAGQFSLNKFLGEDVNKAAIAGLVATGHSPSEAGSAHAQAAGVYADIFHITDFKIASESGQKRSLSYRVETCLANTVGNFGLANRKLDILMSAAGGTALPATSANVEKTGCLFWEARTPEFDVNECAHYIKTSVQLVNKDLGLSQTATLLINPWLRKAVDGRQAQDATQYPESCDGSNVRRQQDNQIFLGTIMMQRISYRPQVLDRSLKLSQRGVYQITMSNSGISDYSNDTAGVLSAPTRALPNGKYLLRLAFLKPGNASQADNGYLGHSNVVMDAVGGIMTGEMEISTRDLRSTMVRKMVLAQLFPIDNQKFNSKSWLAQDPNIEELIDRSTKLVSPVYSAKTVVLGMPGAPIFLKQGTNEVAGISDLITNGLKAKLQSSTLVADVIRAGEAALKAERQKQAFNETDPKTWTQWARQQNLQLVWLSDPGSVQALKEQFMIAGDAKTALQGLIDSGNALDANWAKQFCTILRNGIWKDVILKKSGAGRSGVQGESFVGICQRIVQDNPNAFIKKTSSYRILTMNPGMIQPTALAMSNLSVSSGFGFSRGHTTMQGTQGGAELNSGLAKLVGVGAAYGTVRMDTDDENRHSGTDVGSSVALSVTRWQFDIPVTSYQKCSLLRVDPSVFLYKEGYSKVNPLTWETDKFRLRSTVNMSAVYQPTVPHNPMYRGWLICSDQVTKTPMTVPETYFVVSQGNGDGETFDSVDEINRLFFTEVRGQVGFGLLKAELLASRKYPATGELTDEAFRDLSNEISPLIRRMDEAPGMIVYDPKFEVPKYPKRDTEWTAKSEIGSK